MTPIFSKKSIWPWHEAQTTKYVNQIISTFKDFCSRLSDRLTRSLAGFSSFQLIFSVNSAHKNYKLYLPYSKTTLHLQNVFFCIGSLRWVITPVTKPEKQNLNFVKLKYFEKPFTKNKNGNIIRPRIEYAKIWHQVNNQNMVAVSYTHLTLPTKA